MYRLTPLIFLLTSIHACQSQEDRSVIIGGPCEGCEAIQEYQGNGMGSIDTFPMFLTTEPKILISGAVYQSDGITPASGIIIYAYHTNREGIYQSKPISKGWERRHGFIRGWVKTDAKGQYKFFTFRPGAYPGREIPEHIHLTVLEPGKNPYYIEDILFDDDPFLNTRERSKLRKRGGNGIVQLEVQSGILTGQRDIILGKNIPDYR